jgi:hypothetical protein
MKITITKEVTQEVEVTFPLFTKTISSVFMFKNEDECVCVSLFRDGAHVQKHAKDCFPKSWMLNEACSPDEFYETLKKAMSELNKLK